MLTSKTASKLSIIGALWGNPSVTGGLPPQRCGNVETISISWCNHEHCLCSIFGERKDHVIKTFFIIFYDFVSGPRAWTTYSPWWWRWRKWDLTRRNHRNTPRMLIYESGITMFGSKKLEAGLVNTMAADVMAIQSKTSAVMVIDWLSSRNTTHQDNRRRSQCHGCWCPGSLRHQAIISHDIDNVRQACLP